MSRTRKVKWLGVVERHGDAVTSLKKPGDCVLVERCYPRNLLFNCPDGCGEIITINLDPASGPAWKLYVREDLRTLYPSVALANGCRSHFILWRDKILWCGYDRSRSEVSIDEVLLLAVAGKLRKSRLHFAVLAEQVGELPWEVLWACRKLVRLGRAQEKGTGFFSQADFLNNPLEESPSGV